MAIAVVAGERPTWGQTSVSRAKPSMWGQNTGAGGGCARPGPGAPASSWGLLCPQRPAVCHRLCWQLGHSCP